MVVLKLCLYQNMVNYRVENSFGYVQSYPLPTFSMVRGMAHSLLGLKEYKPLKISIQGKFNNVATNMQRIIKFDKAGRESNPYRVIVNGSQRTATHGIMFVDSLVNCELILHIAFDDKKLTKKLYEKVLTDTVVLGRNEDIARVDFKKTKLVKVKQGEDVILKYPIYIDKKIALANKLVGTYYKLPFCYNGGIHDFKDLRIFKFVECMYVANEGVLNKFYIDDDEDAISLIGVA
jgi:CRISPR-associated protein Cas5t